MGERILMVVSNPARSTTVGGPVGFWASELTHPYERFTRAGCDVTIASPDGGRVEPDAMSNPDDASGYSADDAVSRRWLADEAFRAHLEKTPALGDVDWSSHDALVVCGGQAPMFTFRQATVLHDAVRAFHDAGKPTAALCHGVSALLWVKDDAGEPFLRGRTVTGFANSEEDQADAMVGQKVMPFRIEDEARKLGATYVTEAAWTPFATRDGNLITGQQQHSGAETAKLVIAALREGGR